MQRYTHPLRIIVLLLGVIFLAAQFHSCVDLTSGPPNSHLCPICSTTGSALLTPSATFVITSAVCRLVVLAVVAPIFFSMPRLISPRAPPAV